MPALPPKISLLKDYLGFKRRRSVVKLFLEKRVSRSTENIDIVKSEVGGLVHFMVKY